MLTARFAFGVLLGSDCQNLPLTWCVVTRWLEQAADLTLDGARTSRSPATSVSVVIAIYYVVPLGSARLAGKARVDGFTCPSLLRPSQGGALTWISDVC